MNSIQRLFSGMRISSSGLMAERTRIDVIAENIANARTTSTEGGGAYRRKMVIFEPLVEQARSGDEQVMGIHTPQVVSDDRTPFERVLDPSHPDADVEGFVQYPNVNTVLEMADLITAMRAYEANLTAQQNFVRMAERALELAR